MLTLDLMYDCGWHRFLVTQQPNWQQAKEVAEKFKTSLPPSHNPWFLDLPIEWVPELIELLKQATIENLKARLKIKI